MGLSDSAAHRPSLGRCPLHPPGYRMQRSDGYRFNPGLVSLRISYEILQSCCWRRLFGLKSSASLSLKSAFTSPSVMVRHA